MFHEFFRWLQEDLGKNADGLSWSQQLLGSNNAWPLLEGTHVLTLMLFAGTIWIVDLRLMGVAFKNVSFSKLNDKILPYTVIGFALMIITGLVLFFAKPMVYYHSIWFRAKMIFLVLASLNIFYFHYRVQKNQDQWDSGAPSGAARLSGAISLTSWVIIILLGRFIAYNWFDCGKAQPGFVNWFAECSASASGIVTPDTYSDKAAPAAAASAPAADAAPPAADAAAPDAAAPAAPSGAAKTKPADKKPAKGAAPGRGE